MKIGYGARAAGAVILLTALLTAGGCGYKSDPVPPESVVPRAIDDLRYSIDESGVRLTWSYPVKTIKGTEIVDISSFDIYRAVVPLSDICKTCPIPFGEAIEIPGGITSEEGRRRAAEYRTSLLRSGHKYFFKVRSRTSWWADSADSNIVSFLWHIPAAAPEDVTAAADDSRISLSWKPVASLIDGSAVEGEITYQILRSQGGKEFEVLQSSVPQSSFVDKQVINGQKYFYKVQSQLSFEGNLVDGGVSEVVTSSPIDRTPPPPPSGVRAVHTGSEIKVFWDPSSDSAVAGYRVYRRPADKKTPEQIGEVQAAFTLFVDNDPPAGVRVFYSVTAFDQSEAANESDFSREATIR
ncbi:MAG: hypothetical protein V2I35_10610 [Desulfocapsaceae bacterium]|jgi:hypothetical protein|nr:hypothetical protein [Desulfocapsaceae bacterium]